MPLTDKELDELIDAGATDDEIAELDRESGAATPPAQEPPKHDGFLGRLGLNTLRGALPTGIVEAFKPGLSGVERASTFAGGVGQAAGMGAAALASGGTLPALAKTAAGGALVGAATPVLQPLAEAGGAAGRGIGEAVSGALGLPRTSQSVLANMVGEAPGAIGETLGESVPAAALVALTGKYVPRALQAKPGPELPPAAAALKEAGGRLTPAMTTTGATSKALGGVETAGRVNPLMMGAYSNIDEANAAAVAKMMEERFGTGVLQAGAAPGVGEALGRAGKEIVAKRAADYKPIMEKIKQAGQPAAGVVVSEEAGKIPVGSVGLSKDYVKQVMSRLKDAKDIPIAAKEAFQKAMRKAFRPGMDPQEVEASMNSLKDQFAGEIAGGSVPGAATSKSWGLGQMIDAAKDTYYDSLNSIQKGLGDDLRAAKGDYRAASQAVAPMSKALKALQGAPEDVGPALLAAGSGEIRQLLSWADENVPQASRAIRHNLAKAILQKSGGSAQRLNTLLTKDYKELVPMLQEGGQNLEELMGAAKLARQETLAVKTPSGTPLGVGALAHTGSLAAGLGPLAAKMGVDVGYLYGVPAIQRLLRAGRQATYQPKLGAALQPGPGQLPAWAVRAAAAQQSAAQ